MMLVLSFLVIVYAITMLFYALKFKAYRIENLKQSKPKFCFSIIIPFRNEAENLPQLLEALSLQNYPSSKFEVLLVNDSSEDNSGSICEQYLSANKQIKAFLLDNKNLAKSPKKSAILTALEVVKHEYVLTTDADCLLPESWLLAYDNHLQMKPSDLVAGPVKIIEDKAFWSKFQVLDLMSLQVVGLGSFKTTNPLFCNAANLCYKTKTLSEIQAFTQHQDIISGDDVFTLEAFVRKGKTVSALVQETGLVWTHPERDFKSLTQQRVRWASKAKHYQNKFLIALGFLVLVTNLSLVGVLTMALLLKDFQWFWWLWILKLGVDFFVLYTGNLFFKTHLCLREYLLMLLVYPFASLYFGLLSFGGKFSWKGRKYEI